MQRPRPAGHILSLSQARRHICVLDSAYQGYAITTQVGVKIDRRNPKGGDSVTVTQTFITAYAGLE